MSVVVFRKTLVIVRRQNCTKAIQTWSYGNQVLQTLSCSITSSPRGTQSGRTLKLDAVGILGCALLTHVALAGHPGVQQAIKPVHREIEVALATGKQQRQRGHTARAQEQYASAYRLALKLGDRHGSVRALLGLGACQFESFSYKLAAHSFLQARKDAFAIGDKDRAAAATVNLSSLYFQLHDLSAAEEAAREAVTLLELSRHRDILAKALINYGSIELELNHFDEGKREIFRALSIAVALEDLELQSLAWEYLGESSLNADRLSDAEPALRRAYQLRVHLSDKNSLSLTLLNLADLDYKLHRYRTALERLDQALGSTASPLAALPQYGPVHLRGQILVALGRPDEALSELNKAVQFARQWRLNALPGDVTSTRTVAHLDSVFRDYAALAAEIALQRHDKALARRALQVLSENQAASLREQLASIFHRQGRFPAHYYKLITELQQEQARAALHGNSNSEVKARHIRLELSSIENEIGFYANNAFPRRGPNPNTNSVGRLQRSLRSDELLLRFSLGTTKSYLWAVTADRLSLYELPSAAEISRQIRAFTTSVRTGNESVAGRELSETVFGNIERSQREKKNWLIVAEGAVLNSVPLVALPETDCSGKHRAIGIAHSLRFLPSELLLLSRSKTNSADRFIGVGDPIYNLADPRCLQGSRIFHNKQPSTLLGRLVGSNLEVKTAAQASGLTTVEILNGKRATGVAVAQALSERPEVIHFAVHIVSPPERAAEAALALSITSEDIPELLTSERIAIYRVHGSLIVLSGCSSQQGQILPSAGLIGLSRAWLLAGASAVVVSAWPTRDDSGVFFRSFYEHYRKNKPKISSLAERAALALREAQLDMKRGNGYRSQSSFWAAYSVISRE
jgi:CHAT domain-containing protein